MAGDFDFSDGAEPLTGDPASGGHVAVVEDEPAVARTLARSLRNAGCAITLFDSAEALLESDLALTFNAYLVDIGLPGQDGFALIRTLRNRGVRNPILVMSARGQLNDKLTALGGGADDYLVKGPVDLREVHARLLAQMRRGLRAPAPEAQSAVTLVEGESTLYVRGRRVVLTPVELRIVRALARAHGSTLSYAELVDSVWPSGAGRRQVIATHISNLRRKLKRDAWRLEQDAPVGYRLHDVDVVPELPPS